MSDKPKNWFYTRPYVKATWLMAEASCLMAIASCVMMWTLHQNHIVIKDNSEALQATLTSLELQKVTTSNAISQLQIEEETRLNPELECAYDPINEGFILRNVGEAPAANIYLKTFVVCVTSNQVLELENFQKTNFIGPSLGKKTSLLPGEHGDVDEGHVPDMERLREFWNRFGDDVLVRFYVEYERSEPTYHRYSGYFNFLFNYPHLLTEEESPSVNEAVHLFNSVPHEQQYPVIYKGKDATNEWDVWSDWKHGINNYSGLASGQ
jgi:hypothetical protein